MQKRGIVGLLLFACGINALYSFSVSGNTGFPHSQHRMVRKNMICPFYKSDFAKTDENDISWTLDYWSSRLDFDMPIIVTFSKAYQQDSSKPIQDISTQVYYKALQDSPYQVTRALYHQSSGYNDNPEQHDISNISPLALIDSMPPDSVLVANIIINADQDWVYGEEVSGGTGPNFRSALMRSMAQVLGFTTTVKGNTRGRFSFGAGNHTKFDSLIVTQNGRRLSELSISGSSPDSIKAFLSEDNGPLFLDLPSGRIPMPHKTSIMAGENYAFIDYPGALMDVNRDPRLPAEGADEITLELLEAIGWNVRELENAWIDCPSLDRTTNLMSAYAQNKISLNDSEKVDEGTIRWTLELLDKQGEYIEYTSFINTKEIILPTITDPDSYFISTYQDYSTESRLPARLSVTYSSDDVKHTKKLMFDFSLKPLIADLQVIEYEPNSRNLYEIDIKTEYYGASNMTAMIIDKDRPSVKTLQMGAGPHVEIHHKSLRTADSYRIRVTATNEYGESSKYVTIPTKK